MAEEKKEAKVAAKAKAESGLTEEQQKAEYDRMHKLTVTKLREEAMEKFHDQLKGTHGMHKEELLAAICELMGIHIEVEHHKAKPAAKISDEELKTRMKKLKTQRVEALDAKDKVQLIQTRKKIKKLKRSLRRLA